MSALIRDFQNGTVTILTNGGLPARVVQFYDFDYDWILSKWSEQQQAFLNKNKEVAE